MFGHAYRRRGTGKMMQVGMNYLSELVVRPGMKKRMHPLCLYRGRMEPGRALRLWNFSLLMYAAEVETLSDGIKLQNNEAFAQLCGPIKPLTKLGMCSFFGRLWDNPEVTRNISGFTDYVKSLEIGPSMLQQVDVESNERYVPPWRISTHPEYDPQAVKPESGIRNLFYPYLVHDPEKDDGGKALVMLANELVPHTLPEQWRADVCQDLIIGILAGDIPLEHAQDYVQQKISAAFKILPTKFDEGGIKISLNAPLHGDDNDNRTLMDTI
jgi:hypothetical protein